MSSDPDVTNSYPSDIGDIILTLRLSVVNFHTLLADLNTWCANPPSELIPLLELPKCFADLVAFQQHYAILLQFKPTYDALTIYPTVFGVLTSAEFTKETTASRYYLTKARKDVIDGLYASVSVLFSQLSSYYVIATHHGATRALMAAASP